MSSDNHLASGSQEMRPGLTEAMLFLTDTSVNCDCICLTETRAMTMTLQVITGKTFLFFLVCFSHHQVKRN